jgi:hypothetical protein
MPNLIDKLITKIDAVRQKSADRFGIRAHDMFHVLRTWSGGEIGAGIPTDVETLVTPTPKIKFSGREKLLAIGMAEDRSMEATEISLTYQENFLQGQPLSAGQQCIYKLVERNGQGADTTYWILASVPEVMRDKICWKLVFRPFTVC